MNLKVPGEKEVRDSNKSTSSDSKLMVKAVKGKQIMMSMSGMPLTPKEMTQIMA